MNALVTPASQKELRRAYPLDNLVAGWFFRQLEVSAGCYLTEGRDLYGRTVSLHSPDPQAALRECITFARQVASASSIIS